MPEMNGIDAVRAIRAGEAGPQHSRVPIVMFSTLTERGASATLDALSAAVPDHPVALTPERGSVRVGTITQL